MTKRYKPEDMPSLIPYLTVVNGEESLKFYQEAFGFEPLQVSYDDNHKVNHAEMRFHDVIVMFCPEAAFNTTSKAPITQGITEMPLNLYLYCHDVDTLYQKATKAGAKSKVAPNDGFWGDRYCALIDLNGYEWSFATHLGNENK